MNRLAGIIIAAVGLIVAVLSITKIVPGLTGTGIGTILLGGLIIGLSFIDRPEEDGSERMSTPSTLGNIFISPSEVFANLRRHPRFLIAMLVMSILSATYTNLFLYQLSPDKVTNFAIDKTLEIPMIRDNADQRKRVEDGRQQALDDSKNPVIRVGQAVSGFTLATFGYSFLALIFFLFAMGMGGQINFWQAFSAAVYATFPVNILRFVLNTTILFLKDPTDVHPILGQQSLIHDNLNFLVLSSEHPMIFTILGSLSLLLFYWIWMFAIGLKNAGERVTANTAWSAAISVYFLLVLFFVGLSWAFPSFIS